MKPKWQYHPYRRCTSWRLTINDQRRQLALLLDDNPSLANRISEFLPRSYQNATRAALDETGFLKSPFPMKCAYDIAVIMHEGYWPE